MSGVERQVEWKSVKRKKRLQHLPSSLSFLLSASPPSCLVLAQRRKKRKKEGLLKINRSASGL